jgi:PAS domain S-box-containing protein
LAFETRAVGSGGVADQGVPWPPRWLAYLLAAGLATAGVGLRMPLDPLLGSGTPFILCFPAVLVAALYLGLGPALLCIGLCVVGTALRPALEGLAAGLSGQDVAGIAVFVGVAAAMSVLAERYRRAGVRAAAATAEARSQAARLEAEGIERRRVEEAVHLHNEELQTTVEELELAEEELRTQNEELHDTRQKLDAERRRYRGLFELAPDAYIVTDLKGVIREANQAAGRLLGVAGSAGLVGEPLMGFIAEDRRQAFRAELEELKATEGSHGWDGRVNPPGGGMVEVSIAATAERDQTGEPVALRWLLRDVTEKRCAEEARARLAAIVESSDDAIIGKDLNGFVTSWNQGAQRLFGYTAAEMVGRPVLLLVPPEREDEEAGILVKLRRGEKIDHFDTVRRTKGGRLIDVSLTVSPIRDERGRVVGASTIARDVTERRRAEQTRARLAAIVESSDDAIISKDLSGVIRSWNTGAQRLFGYTAPEIIGRSVAVLIPEDHADEEPEILRRIGRGESVDHYETIRRTKDGRRIEVSLTVSPIRDERGRVVGASKIARDIGERKRAAEELARHRDRLAELVGERTAELEKSHQALRLSERMAALGTLSAGLGHDMGNLLLPIRARLDVLQARELPEPVREDLKAISTCAQYLQELSRGLRLFALDPERSDTTGEVTVPADWAREATPFFRTVLGKDVEFECDVPADLPPIGVAPHRLSQGVLNLLNNARDAVAGGSGGNGAAGRVTLTFRREAVEGSREAAVRVVVTDNGPGMSEEVRRRCMEPFYTTKTRGISTGLGLSLVHGIVKAAGGSLRIESAPGRGASIAMVLPVASAPPALMINDRSALVTLRDQRVASLVSGILRVAGFGVTVAAALPPEAPPGLIWFADASAAPERIEEARRFLAADPANRLIIVGDAGPEWAQMGAAVLRSGVGPSAIRAALGDLLPESAAGGAKGAG